MKKFLVSTFILIVIAGILAVFVLDIFNLRYSREAALASIIAAEDSRRISGSLLEKSSDPDPEVRARAASAIGRIGDKRYIDGLFDMMDDSSEQVIASAVYAVGLAGVPSYAIRLLEVSEGLPPDLRAGAIRAIGLLVDSTMNDLVAELITYLEDTDHRVREAAACALARTNTKSARSGLEQLCRADPVRPVRIAALYALVNLGIGAPAELYAEMYSDSDPFVRVLALRGLAIDGDNQKISNIAYGLNDRDNNVVSQAISSLTKIQSDKVAGYLKARYANETDVKLKVQLLESFTKLDNADLTDYAFDDIHQDTISYNIKAAAIVYLAKILQDEAMALLDSLTDLNVRMMDVALVKALQEVGGTAVIPRLVSFYNDSIPEVRAAAFDALGTIDSGNIDYYLRTSLADDDYMVQIHAVDMIARLKREDYLHHLATLMKVGLGIHPDLKRSIVAAAGKFLHGEQVDAAEDILYHGLLDDEYLVSRDAAQIYMTGLQVDKSASVTLPYGLISENKIKSLIRKYRTNPQARIFTDRGEIGMELYFDAAPLNVYNFMKLAREGFYDGLTFHRVIPAFVVQGGDPRGDGWGDPGYYVRCEYSDQTFKRGTVGMAHSGKDSGGSQFFITLMPQPHLDSRYTIIGQITSGMEIVDKIIRGDTIQQVLISTGENE